MLKGRLGARLDRVKRMSDPTPKGRLDEQVDLMVKDMKGHLEDELDKAQARMEQMLGNPEARKLEQQVKGLKVRYGVVKMQREEWVVKYKKAALDAKQLRGLAKPYLDAIDGLSKKAKLALDTYLGHLKANPSLAPAAGPGPGLGQAGGPAPFHLPEELGYLAVFQEDGSVMVYKGQRYIGSMAPYHRDYWAACPADEALPGLPGEDPRFYFETSTDALRYITGPDRSLPALPEAEEDPANPVIDPRRP